MNDKYPILLFWSSVDTAWIAESPDLPGCLAHGATPEEAVKEIRVAIGLWLETAKEENRVYQGPSTWEDWVGYLKVVDNQSP